MLIPPYNHPHVISGQGTMALELLEQVGMLSSAAALGTRLLSDIQGAQALLRPSIAEYACARSNDYILMDAIIAGSLCLRSRSAVQLKCA